MANKYKCTDCGDDATIAYTEGWNGLIKKGERLCLPCGRKRGINLMKMIPKIYKKTKKLVHNKK